MVNNPTKHRPPGTERHQGPGISGNAKGNHGSEKKPLANFLLETDIKPLVFLGQCVQYFGLAAVAAFLLGAVSVYGYACLIKPLPFAKTTEASAAIPVTQPAQSKMVKLHGVVRDSEGKPVKEAFSVGVLAKQLGPVQNSDGSFALEVPQRDSYDVALWNSDTVKVYVGFAAEADGNGYRLQQALPFLQAVSTVSAQDSRSAAHLAQVQPGGR